MRVVMMIRVSAAVARLSMLGLSWSSRRHSNGRLVGQQVLDV